MLEFFEALNSVTGGKYSLALVVTALIVQIANSIYHRKEIIGWGMEGKIENDLFYLRVMLLSIIEILIVAFVHDKVTYVLLRKLLGGNILIYIDLFVIILFMCFCLHSFPKWNFIRLRLVGMSKWHSVLVCMPFAILSLILVLVALNMETTYYGMILLICFLVAEALGMMLFPGRYKRYKYSYADISLKNGEKIKAVNIDNISRKPGWILIKTANSETRIKSDELVEVKYFGEPKIELIENYWMPFLKRLRSVIEKNKLIMFLKRSGF